jgi:hypothetical protein
VSQFPEDAAGRIAVCSGCKEKLRVPLPERLAAVARQRIATAPEQEEEPWFYGFAAGYGRVCLLLILLLGIPLAGFAVVKAMGQDLAQGAITAGAVVIALLVSIMPIALIFLLVDVGRNIRELKSRRPHDN